MKSYNIENLGINISYVFDVTKNPTNVEYYSKRLD